MLFFVSTNPNKIDKAELFLRPLGIPFEVSNIKLIEIQSDSVEEIVIDKAKKAFQILNSPLLVNDHVWSISALNGFPGPYMKYINQWFSPQDFLNLMKDKKDREMKLTEYICYTDGNIYKTFFEEIKGHVLFASKGKGEPWKTVSSYSKDNSSVAEKLETHPSAIGTSKVYEDFAKWYKGVALSS